MKFLPDGRAVFDTRPNPAQEIMVIMGGPNQQGTQGLGKARDRIQDRLVHLISPS